MAKKKPSTPVTNVELLTVMRDTYEDALFGSVSPTDVVKPLIMLSSLCQRAAGLGDRPPEPDFYGDMLLLVLISAKRGTVDVAGVIREAADNVRRVEPAAEATRSRREDDAKRAKPAPK